MTTAAPGVVCANPACRVAETGKCVEGLALDQCKQYGRAPGATTALGAVDGTAPAVEEEAGLALPSGERLTAAEVPAVLRGRASRVVAVLGATASGKTSLIASLHGLFQDGPVSQFSFAGSRTLFGFEQACHHSRAASMRATPHTERTPRGSFGLYHLALRPSGSEDALELLLTDRAGEEYLAMADDPTNARSFVELSRADTIALLVDGDRLLDSGGRHNHRSELGLMLQAMHDGDVLRPGQRLAIVLTKLDKLARSNDRERAEGDFARVVADARQHFAKSFAAIEEFRVAASPSSDAFARGHGLAAVLDFWMQPTVVGLVATDPPPPTARAFGRLAGLRIG